MEGMSQPQKHSVSGHESVIELGRPSSTSGPLSEVRRTIGSGNKSGSSAHLPLPRPGSTRVSAIVLQPTEDPVHGSTSNPVSRQ